MNQTFFQAGFLQVTRESINFLLPNGAKLPIRWYGISYLLSYLVITWQIRREVSKTKLGITPSELQWIADFILLGGIVGGRLWYLVFRYVEYGTSLAYKPFHVWEGGMAFQGGLILGLISGTAYLYYIKKFQCFAKLADIITSKIPLGIMIGRVGNFMNQEFMNPVFGIPSCLFSSLTEGLLPFILLNYTFNLKKHKHLTTISFFTMYALIRFINDFFREEDLYQFAGLSLKFSQYVCIGIFFTAILFFFFRLVMNFDSAKK